MKKFLFFTTVLSLVAISTFAGGVGVGNGKQVYRFGRSYSVEYEKDLSLAVESPAAFQISNDKLVQAGEKVSSIHFTVTHDLAHDQTEVAALAAKEHPGLTFSTVTEPGARGVYFERKDGKALNGFYYLLTTNLDLIEVAIEAYPEGNGLAWVAPIVNSFVYDSTPPTVHELRIPNLTWGAGTTQKIYFRADDDYSGVDTTQASVAIDRADAGKLPSKHYRLVQDVPIQSERNDWYSVEFHLGEYVTPGEYLFDWLGLNDRAHNDGGLAVGNGTDKFYRQNNKPDPHLPVIHLTVTNSGPSDITPPRVVEIRVDSSTWEAGTTHRVYLKIVDDVSGVDVSNLTCDGLVSAFNVSGREFRTEHCRAPRAEGHDWYSMEIPLSPNLPSGDYEIQSISAKDRAGNLGWLTGGTVYVDPRRYDDENGAWTIPVFHVNVRNAGVADTQGPVVTELRAEKDVISAGEPLRIRFRATDPAGGLKLDQDGFFGIIYPVDNVPGRKGVYINDAAVFADGDDWYHLDVPTSPFVRSGEYYLDYFYVYGNSGSGTLLNCDQQGKPHVCTSSNGPDLPELRFQIER